MPGVPIIEMGCFITIHGKIICLSGSLIVEKAGAVLILLYIILDKVDWENERWSGKDIFLSPHRSVISLSFLTGDSIWPKLFYLLILFMVLLILLMLCPLL